MGFLKNFLKKINNAVASLKSSGQQKVLSKADINLANQSMVNGQLLQGRSNFDEKRASFEDASTKHFFNYFKGKTLEDVSNYVTNLKNFSSESEFLRQIENKNRRRAMSGDKSKLSIQDLYKYLAGGQGLSPKDIIAYKEIASQTQSKARALSYIKSNFAGICNMRDLSSDKDKKSFDKIMDAVKLYADKDINNFAVSDFDHERINSTVLNSDNVYLKGVSYAELRTRDIFDNRVDESIKIANETLNILSTLNQNGEKFDKDIDKIIENNTTIEKKTEENSYYKVLTDALKNAHDEFSNQSQSNKLNQLWIGTSRHSKGEKKAILDRQKKFMAMFSDIAGDFQLFGTQKDGSVFVKDNSLEDMSSYINIKQQGADNVNNLDLFSVSGVNGKDNYSKLIGLIKEYESDDTIDHSNDLFVIKDGKNNSPTIYTKDQDRIMKEIYQRLVEYAVDSVNDPNYEGTNALKNFGYKNFRHSINNTSLANLSETLFSQDFDKNTVALTYEELDGKQIESLYNFIADNDPVKSLLSNSDVKTFEIDKLLVNSINPNSPENIDTPKNCMLDAVMTDMRLKALQNEIDRANDQKFENNDIIKTAKEERDTLYEDAKKVQETVKNTATKVQDLEKVDYAEDNVNINYYTNIIAKNIDSFVGYAQLPESAEKIGTEKDKVKKYEQTRLITLGFKDALNKFVKNASKDKARFDSLSLEEKAELYALYFSKNDKQTVQEFVDQVENIIKHDNVLTTADYGLEEKDF